MLIKRSRPDPHGPIGIIDLGDGYKCIVDSEDLEWLTQWTWTYKKSRCCVYAVRKTHIRGREVLIRMHRQIIHAPPGTHVHHSNHNTLDNRKCNLIVVSPEQHRILHNRA